MANLAGGRGGGRGRRVEAHIGQVCEPRGERVLGVAVPAVRVLVVAPRCARSNNVEGDVRLREAYS